MTPGRAALVAFLSAATALNAAFQWGRDDDAWLFVSRLEVGDSLPDLRAREATCQVIVAFQSSCPFCGAAAERERAGEGRLPTRWVAPSHDPGGPEYASRVHLPAPLPRHADGKRATTTRTREDRAAGSTSGPALLPPPGRIARAAFLGGERPWLTLSASTTVIASISAIS